MKFMAIAPRMLGKRQRIITEPGKMQAPEVQQTTYPFPLYLKTIYAALT